MTPYRRLEGGEIRLVRIDTLSTDLESTLKCTLTNHHLKDAQEKLRFSALSYTWGQSHPDAHTLCKGPWNPNCRVICNGVDVTVTENLYDFLHHCATDRTHSLQGYLWIDALCIDQSSISERGEQVRIMGDIYKAAERVILWLGPGDVSGDLAFDLMDGLASLSHEKRIQLDPHNVRNNHPNALLDRDNWISMIRFFQRTWFNRAWVIQEVVFSKSAVVLCGDRSLSWDRLALISEFLATTNWTNYMKAPGHSMLIDDDIKCWHNTPTRLAASKETYASETNDGLLYALIRSRSAVCQDPLDKVYSQLGLGRANLFPDYSLSPVDAYIAAAEYVLKNSDSLFLLTCVEGKLFQLITGLPSWVPDWSMTKHIGLGVTGYPQFHADRLLPREYDLYKDEEKRILKIRAAKFDHITMMCERKKDLQPGLHSSALWDMIASLDPIYNTGQPREEVLWRSLMTNRGTIPPPERVQYPALSDELEPSFRAWVLWSYANTSSEPKSFPIPSSSNSILPTRVDIEEARAKSKQDRDYLDSLTKQASLYNFSYSLSVHERPFCTQQGYFGIGSECLEVNDSLWIVPGCCVPIILRPIEGSTRYSLVGGAYVHGIMDGEALDREDLKFEMVDLE